jgi:peptidoglycan/LPS O-acetylase OafA/YrhL
MRSIRFRPDLQGLRAAAVLLVIINHAGFSLFPGGFVGVDIFFVLSGYLISGLLIKEYQTNSNIQFLAFISRRLQRLLPALTLMLSVSLLVSPLLISNHELEQQFRSIFFAATWTSNLFFAFSKLDYFSELQSRDFFLHTWSLGVEEQFYIFWPLLLALFFGYLSRRQNKDNPYKSLLWLFFILFILSLSLCLYWSNQYPLWSFYLMPARIWQFALGASIYVLALIKNNKPEVHKNKILVSLEPHLSALGLIFIFGSAIFLHNNISYPGYWAIFPSLGAALVIAGKDENFTYRLLSNRFSVGIGNRSYSWYLWHWPILMFGFAWGAQNHLAVIVILIGLSLGLASLTYRYVELPFWKGKYSSSVPSKTIATSIITILLFTTGSLKLFNFVYNAFDNLNVPYTNAKADVPSIYYAYPEGCDSWYYDAKIQPCIIGDKEAQKTLLLAGDSIGAMWVSMLPEIFKSPQWRIVVLTKSSCPMVDKEYYYERIKKIYTVCTEWRKDAILYIQNLRPELIVLGDSPTYPFNREEWIEGTKTVLSQLTGITKHIIIIPGTPIISFDGPSCLARWNANGPGIVVRWLNEHRIYFLNSENFSCQEKTSTTLYDEVSQYLNTASQAYPNVHLLNLNDLVCPDGICSAQNSSGTIVFRDGRHLTNSFVLSQAPNIINKINALGLIGYID